MLKRNLVTISLTGAVLAGAFSLAASGPAGARSCGAGCKYRIRFHNTVTGPNTVSKGGNVMINPQPLPPRQYHSNSFEYGGKVMINPQPLPPRTGQR